MLTIQEHVIAPLDIFPVQSGIWEIYWDRRSEASREDIQCLVLITHLGISSSLENDITHFPYQIIAFWVDFRSEFYYALVQYYVI